MGTSPAVQHHEVGEGPEFRSQIDNWESGDVLKSELGWPLLRQRRRFQKLCLARRILTSDSLIPDSTFSPHLAPNLRHLNTCPLQQPFDSTNYFRSSFFVDVVPLWNSLPGHIVSLSSNLASQTIYGCIVISPHCLSFLSFFSLFCPLSFCFLFCLFFGWFVVFVFFVVVFWCCCIDLLLSGHLHISLCIELKKKG